LAHEHKHLIDYPFENYAYPKSYGLSPTQRAEQICDYFAACLLMPKMLVRRAWTTGGDNQDPAELAHLFGVSQVAMEIRLQELGLIEAKYRCRQDGRSSRPMRRYYRTSQETRELLPTPAGQPLAMVAASAGGA
jgi:Zn-dependent peptidase ImmA (M78 family)